MRNSPLSDLQRHHILVNQDFPRPLTCKHGSVGLLYKLYAQVLVCQLTSKASRVVTDLSRLYTESCKAVIQKILQSWWKQRNGFSPIILMAPLKTATWSWWRRRYPNWRMEVCLIMCVTFTLHRAQQDCARLASPGVDHRPAYQVNRLGSTATYVHCNKCI